MKKALMILLLAFPFISINKFHADEVVENNEISTYGKLDGLTDRHAIPIMAAIQDILVPGDKEATIANVKKLLKRDYLEKWDHSGNHYLMELIDYDKEAKVESPDRVFNDIVNLRTPDRLRVWVKCKTTIVNEVSDDGTVSFAETIFVYDKNDPNTKFLNTEVDLVDKNYGTRFTSPVMYKINEKKRFDINKDYPLDLMKLKLAPLSAYGNTAQGQSWFDPVDNVNYDLPGETAFDNCENIIRDNVVSWKLIEGEEIIKAKKPGVYTLTYQMIPITELGYNYDSHYLIPTFPENTEFPTVDVEVEFYDGNSTGNDQANNSDSVNTETKPTETVTYPEANKQNNVKQQKEKVATSDINNLFVILPVVIISCLILYIRRKI